MDAASDTPLAGTAELALTPKHVLRATCYVLRATCYVLCAACHVRHHVLRCGRACSGVLIRTSHPKAGGLHTKSHPFLQCVTRFPKRCLR
jgi:hypothetical protein